MQHSASNTFACGMKCCVCDCGFIQDGYGCAFVYLLVDLCKWYVCACLDGLEEELDVLAGVTWVTGQCLFLSHKLSQVIIRFKLSAAVEGHHTRDFHNKRTQKMF